MTMSAAIVLWTLAFAASHMGLSSLRVRPASLARSGIAAGAAASAALYHFHARMFL